jgi:hypothetical protein
LDDFNIINWGATGYGTIHFLLQLEEALKSKTKPAMATPFLLNEEEWFQHETSWVI